MAGHRTVEGYLADLVEFVDFFLVDVGELSEVGLLHNGSLLFVKFRVLLHIVIMEEPPTRGLRFNDPLLLQLMQVLLPLFSLQLISELLVHLCTSVLCVVSNASVLPQFGGISDHSTFDTCSWSLSVF